MGECEEVGGGEGGGEGEGEGLKGDGEEGEVVWRKED